MKLARKKEVASMATEGRSLAVGIARNDASSSDLITPEHIGVLDAIDLPVIIVSRECTVTRVNRAAMTVLDMTISDIGRTLGDVFAGAENIEGLCRQVIADGAPCRIDTRQGDRHFLLRIAPCIGGDHQIVGAALTATNVTAFRASIDQAIYEREYTKAILNTIIDPLVVLDFDLCVQTANRAFYAMFGFSRDQTQGVPISALGNNAWKTSVAWESLNNMLSGDAEFPTVEMDRDFPAIGLRTVLLEARRLMRDENPMILLAFHDITERKKDHERLVADVAALRRLHEISTKSSAHSDLVTLLGEVLDAAIAVTGTDMGNVQLVEPETGDLKIIVQRGFAKDFLDYFNAVRKGMAACGIAMKNGSRAIVENVESDPLLDDDSRKVMLAAGARSVQSTPFITRSGQLLGMFSTHYRAARSFDERNFRLLDMLAQQAADLIERQSAEQELLRINDELRRANADLNQFAYAASHDLQEPLRMITSYSQMLMKGYQGELDEAALCVKFITAGTQRMRDLLADLLVYTQVNDAACATEIVDLNQVLEKQLENLKVSLDESKAVVTHDELPPIRGHEAHFLQIFQNLISNALKYRKTDPPAIHIASRPLEDVWLFSVADNGIGIDSAYHQDIFGVFKRLHGREVPGTGIGLAICKRAVERYGGRIWVESQIDHGSTFYFTLPAIKRDVRD
jgi:PAS domain S-box-containing protein